MKIDRIQMVVPEREAAAERWRRLLDAQVVREDEVQVLGARRSGVGVGTSEVEIIHPFDRNKTMGRFHAKWGDSLYMGYVESDRTDEIRRRALEHGPEDWTGPREGERPDNLFLHPRALGGVMLGVSRTTFAWTWSGAPESVAP
jgi:hypothetical protein